MNQKKTFLFVLLILAFWLAMLAGDWFMRFYWYRWHEVMFRRPPSAVNAARREPVCRQAPPSRGGNLSNLLGIPSLAAKYEEPRSGGEICFDAFGFKNLPETRSADCDIVVVGDSFMVEGTPMTNMFSVRLSRLLNRPVYNYAVAARGPIFALTEFFDDRRFIADPPHTLIWGLIESEVRSELFSGSLVWQLWIDEHPEDEHDTSHTKITPARMMRQRWSPPKLKVSLPSSSAVTQFSRKIWNRIRYVILGRVHPDIIRSRRAEDRRTLFYGINYEYLLLSDQERDMNRVIWAMEYVHSFCSSRGIQLITVFIPDKAQVYRHLLPEDRAASTVMPQSCLWTLDEELQERKIPALNLLPVFRDRALAGEQLFWRDDTHWNDKGIAIAAEMTAKYVKPYMDMDNGSLNGQ